MSHDTLRAVAQDLSRADVTELYAAIGEGTISSETVVRQLVMSQGGEAGVEETLSEAVTPTRIQHRRSANGDSAVVVQSIESSDVLVKLAKCCTPVPPDKIVGFVTRGNGLSVHRADCSNVVSLRREPERFIEVDWSETADAVYLVQVQVEALDRQGLLHDISRVLNENGVNLLQATMSTSKERVAKSHFVFEMADPRHLQNVLREMRKIEGVYDAYRVTGSKKTDSRRVKR